jgi:transcriptional regulator with XRE-family HTH domain
MSDNLIEFDPLRAVELLQKHFSTTSTEEFVDNVERFCPEMMENEAMDIHENQTDEQKSQLILFRPQASPLRLDAYLACALTGLANEQRQLMFHLSDIVATVCAEQGIDLYEPRKKTDPVHHGDVPDSEVFSIDRARVLNSDLLIHLCHYPSTGAGEELDFAFNALVPIILISHSDVRVSRMVTGIPSFKIVINYTEPEDLRRELRDSLIKARPILEERKLAFSKYDANIVGNKIRMLREELRLTREEVAKNVEFLTLDGLRQIEESSDRTSNPSLIQLRQIATVLKTTVADLVEPDLNERLVSVLEDWITGANRAAARFPGMTIKDRNRILRRFLYRVVDSLEKD